MPDFITAGLFLAVWRDPFAWGQFTVKNFMLVMMLEFLVVHSSGFVAAVIYDPESTRVKRTRALIGISAFYLLFVGAWAFAFDARWLLVAFGWLMLSRLAAIWFDPAPQESERTRQMTLWAASVALYLFGTFLTVTIPLPYFGITPELVPSFGLTGKGAWLEQPHTVIAFGAIYYSGLGLVKLLFNLKRIPGRAA